MRHQRKYKDLNFKRRCLICDTYFIPTRGNMKKCKKCKDKKIIKDVF